MEPVPAMTKIPTPRVAKADNQAASMSDITRTRFAKDFNCDAILWRSSEVQIPRDATTKRSGLAFHRRKVFFKKATNELRKGADRLSDCNGRPSEFIACTRI